MCQDGWILASTFFCVSISLSFVLIHTKTQERAWPISSRSDNTNPCHPPVIIILGSPYEEEEEEGGGGGEEEEEVPLFTIHSFIHISYYTTTR